MAANQLLGKGQENLEDYQGVERIIQLGIQNIHVLREAYDNLRDAICDYCEQNKWKQSQVFCSKKQDVNVPEEDP